MLPTEPNPRLPLLLRYYRPHCRRYKAADVVVATLAALMALGLIFVSIKLMPRLFGPGPVDLRYLAAAFFAPLSFLASLPFVYCALRLFRDRR